MITRYADLTGPEAALLAQSPATVAILPLGAMEQHGGHLPLGTDGVIADAILDHAAERLGGAGASFLRLPVLWLGASGEHEAEPGTLSLEAATMVAVLDAALAGLARSGFRKVLLLNAHGGNIAACEIASLNARRRSAQLVAHAHWSLFGMPPGDPAIAAATKIAPTMGDVHGGWLETAIMLAAAPHAVTRPLPSVPAKAPPASALFPSGPIPWGWLNGDLGQAGSIGQADLATAEMGAALLQHFGQALANLVLGLSAADWPQR